MTESAAVWHIITPEYPPIVGGVADYTANVARGLTATGASVQVWTRGEAIHPEQESAQLRVYRMAGRFGPQSLSRLDQHLARSPAPRRLLVQYVPHGYGYKAMNLPFALWLYKRRLLHHDAIDVMFHEVAYPWVRRPLRHNLLAGMNRIMAALIARSARRIFCSIPSWFELLRGLANPRTPLIWSPIPAARPSRPTSSERESIRHRYLQPGQRLIGHFGTYGAGIATLLPANLLTILADPRCQVLLIGLNSDRWRTAFVQTAPQIAARIQATGGLGLEAVSTHLAACDLLVLPYPDGISSRRTTAMLGLAQGVPIVSNRGPLTEPLWTTEQVALCDDPLFLGKRAIELLDQPQYLDSLGERGQVFYDQYFDIRHTLAHFTESKPLLLVNS